MDTWNDNVNMKSSHIHKMEKLMAHGAYSDSWYDDFAPGDNHSHRGWMLMKLA